MANGRSKAERNTIATVPKMRPRTKHLNIKYHHFREEVRKGTVSILKIR